MCRRGCWNCSPAPAPRHYPTSLAGRYELRQVVIGIPYLVAEDGAGVIQAMGNGASANVGVEDALIQHKNLDECRETKLSSLQNEVAVVQLIHQVCLGPVHLELYPVPALVRYPVEVV